MLWHPSDASICLVVVVEHKIGVATLFNSQVKEFNLPLKNNQLKVMKFIGLINDDERYWSKDLLGDTSTRWTTLTAEVSANKHPMNLRDYHFHA